MSEEMNSRRGAAKEIGGAKNPRSEHRCQPVILVIAFAHSWVRLTVPGRTRAREYNSISTRETRAAPSYRSRVRSKLDCSYIRLF